MSKKKSIHERRQDKLLSLTAIAVKAIKTAGIKEFPRSWLVKNLGVTDKEAAQIASQMKKDLFLFGDNKRPDEEEMTGTLYRVRT